MIVTSLFKPTQSLFEAWTRATIGYALMPVAAAGAAGIIVAIAEAIGDASADPGDVETVSLILPFLVILILSAGIMASVPLHRLQPHRRRALPRMPWVSRALRARVS